MNNKLSFFSFFLVCDLARVHTYSKRGLSSCLGTLFRHKCPLKTLDTLQTQSNMPNLTYYCFPLVDNNDNHNNGRA